MAKKSPFPIPNFDWSHMPLGWNEFIGGEANQHATKPLMTDEYGVIKVEYYGSLPCWPVPMALQILDNMNWNRGLGFGEQVMEKIWESMRLSYAGREGWLMISLHPEKDENGCSLVNAFLFCNWADYKGFNINRTMREAQIGFDNNRHPRREELIKMLRLHLSYQENLRKKALQEQEAKLAKAKEEIENESEKKQETPEPVENGKKVQKPVNEEPPQYSIKLDGDICIIFFKGVALPLYQKDLGFLYIQDVIKSYPESISCLDLYAPLLSGTDNPMVVNDKNHEEANRSIEKETDTATVQAVMEEKKRLEEELNLKMLSGDGNRQEENALELEIEKLNDYLSRATNKMGMPKTIPREDEEKARKNVYNAIKRAINKIEKDRPELAEHFNKEIVTGNMCKYKNSAGIKWET